MPNAAKWWTFGEAKGLNQRGQPLLGGEGGVLLESENLSFDQQGGFVQRFGSAPLTLDGFGFTGIVEWLGRFTTVGGVEELWGAANNAGTPALGRRVGSARSSVAFSDTPDPSNLRYMQSASLTSKYFLAYDSDVNRLHVWDGDTLRRVGLGRPAAPQVDPMGAGTLSDTRYYRVRYVELDGTTIVRRSEASDATSLIIASKVGWQITKPAALGEGETHWEIEASDAEAGPWWRIARESVMNTVYEDPSAVIDDTDLSPLDGEYIPPPSAKFLVSDTNRILLAGAWEATTAADQTEIKQNRVWYTPVLGSTDEGDDERIPNTVDQQNWVDVGNEGPITALAGPLYGDIYVFKYDSVFKLTSTGDLVTPYRVIQVMAGIGAVHQRVVCIGELGTGTPAIFFASASSVYAITSGGIVEMSNSVSRDLRMTNFSTASSWLAYDPYDKSLKAQTNSGVSSIPGQYFQFTCSLKDRMWTGWSVGGSEASWILGVSLLGVNTILGGGGAEIRNTVVAQNDNGSFRLLLCGQNDAAAAQILACGDVCGVDGETAFVSRLRVRKFPTPGHNFTVGAPTLVYRSPTGTSASGVLTVSYLNHKGSIVSQSAITLEPTDPDDPTQQHMKTLDSLQGNLSVLDVRMTLSYDGSFLTAIPPSIDAFLIPVTEKETYAQ